MKNLVTLKMEEANGEPQNAEVTVLEGICDGCCESFTPEELKNFEHFKGEYLCPNCYKERLGEEVLDESSLEEMVGYLEKYTYNSSHFYEEWFNDLPSSIKIEMLARTFPLNIFSMTSDIDNNTGKNRETNEHYLREYLRYDSGVLKELSELYIAKEKEQTNG